MKGRERPDELKLAVTRGIAGPDVVKLETSAQPVMDLPQGS